MTSEERLKEARATFGRSFHSTAVLTHRDPDSPGAALCYWCNAPHTTTAAVNVWGTVNFIPSCQAHRDKYHGLCADVLPSADPGRMFR